MKHYLNFIKPNYGRFEITEPIGFDAFSSKITQGKERFGRDKEIGGGASAELEFNDVYGKKTTPYILVNGSVCEYLTHRLDLIFQAVNEFGSECEIQYELEENSVVFTTGLIDVSESDTDTYRSFKCTIVQNTNKAIIERKKDVVVNVFSEIDTFDNPIVPLEKERILLKAKPVLQVSEWDLSVDSFDTSAGFFEPTFWNNMQNLKTFGIEDSLSFFDVAIAGDSSTPNIKGVGKIISAKNELTNIQVKYKLKVTYTGFVQFPEVSYDPMQFAIKVFKTNFDGSDWTTAVNNAEILYTSPLIYNNDTDTLDLVLEYEMPVLYTGELLYVLGQTLSTGASGSFRGVSFDDFGSELTITATSTAVDSVIFGVSEYNFWKQGVKSLSGLDLDADILLNDKYVFNGSLIRQKDDTALNFKFNDEANDLMAFLNDYQINENNIEILSYPEYYQNIDMGFFNVLPEIGFSRTFNDRFKKITLSFGFKTYEQNRDEKNTIDAVHTDSQFLFPNKQVEGDLKVSINGIYDPFTIETSRREATNATTSLSTDDKIFKIDTVAIPEGSTNIYRGVLTMRVNEVGILEILSNNFNWTLLGFNNGNTVTLTGVNEGEYSILQHSQNLLELVNVGDAPDFTGTAYIEIQYPLTNVFLTNRTDEGFDVIENIEVPDNFSNLKYTIKRILTNDAWSSYLATLCKDVPNATIKNTDFKVNGELITQFEGGLLIQENADIDVISDAKILNKYIFKTSIAVGFEQANQLINDTKTIKGFIRILGADGKILRVHLQDMVMIWNDGIMDIVAEARNEIDFVKIQSTVGGVNIFEIGYDTVIDTSINWFKSDNGYFQIFDNDLKPLINPTRYDKIQVDGIIYSNDFDLYNVLLSL
jgi:hypothetical protein